MGFLGFGGNGKNVVTADQIKQYYRANENALIQAKNTLPSGNLWNSFDNFVSGVKSGNLLHYTSGVQGVLTENNIPLPPV